MPKNRFFRHISGIFGRKKMFFENQAPSHLRHYHFSWNFTHWCKMVMSKMWPSPIFEKHFSGRKCRKYAVKTGFLAFSRDFIICFSCFFAQKRVLAIPKIWLSPIFDNIFFGRKCLYFHYQVGLISMWLVLFVLKKIPNFIIEH